MTLDASIEAWVADVVERFAVSPDERILLEEAAELRQRISDCQAVIERDGLMLPTRGGGTRLHPAARLQADTRGLLLRFLREMNLHQPEEDNTNGIH